jgi:hypothetical protein
MIAPVGPPWRLENGHALVVAVLELFLQLARPEQTRMRDLLDEHADAGDFSTLSRRACRSSRSAGKAITHGAVVADRIAHIGTHPQHTGLAWCTVGACVPPLGRLDPSMLRGCATGAPVRRRQPALHAVAKPDAAAMSKRRDRADVLEGLSSRAVDRPLSRWRS